MRKPLSCAPTAAILVELHTKLALFEWARYRKVLLNHFLFSVSYFSNMSYLHPTSTKDILGVGIVLASSWLLFSSLRFNCQSLYFYVKSMLLMAFLSFSEAPSIPIA